MAEGLVPPGHGAGAYGGVADSGAGGRQRLAFAPDNQVGVILLLALFSF